MSASGPSYAPALFPTPFPQPDQRVPAQQLPFYHTLQQAELQARLQLLQQQLHSQLQYPQYESRQHHSPASPAYSTTLDINVTAPLTPFSQSARPSVQSLNLPVTPSSTAISSYFPPPLANQLLSLPFLQSTTTYLMQPPFPPEPTLAGRGSSTLESVHSSATTQLPILEAQHSPHRINIPPNSLTPFFKTALQTQSHRFVLVQRMQLVQRKSYSQENR
jgi:hypothetical protein